MKLPSIISQVRLHWFIDHAANNKDEGVRHTVYPRSLLCLLTAVLESWPRTSTDLQCNRKWRQRISSLVCGIRRLLHRLLHSRPFPITPLESKQHLRDTALC